MIHPDLKSLAVPLDQLVLLDGNPHRGDVVGVARSYKRFGQRKPIVCRHLPSGQGQILAGNTQYQAARQLGWEEIAVVWVDDEDDEAYAFAVADNHTAELGSTDDDALANILSRLSQKNPDLLTVTGYSDAELAKLLAVEEPDVSPQLPYTYRVVVDCVDEDQQADLLNEFEGRGLTVKALMS